MKKLVFLVFTLAIPVSIFLFLKFFGNNEFEVPYFFEEGIKGCEGSSPHYVPRISYSNTEGEQRDNDIDSFLIYMIVSDCKGLDDPMREMVRIQDAFFEVGSPDFLLLTNQDNSNTCITDMANDRGFDPSHYQVGYMDAEDLVSFKKCGLGIGDRKQGVQLVLVDPVMRIRGIYNALDQKETEKLILELRILRNK